MANYKTGPTRDWTDLMNAMVSELVKAGKPNAALPGEFSHVYLGSVETFGKFNGVTSKSIGTRLEEIGWLEYKGRESAWQGKAIWHVRDEYISKEDAVRADYLYRQKHRDKKRGKQDTEPAASKTQYEVGEDQLHPGKHVTKTANGPGEYARMNREIVALEEQLARAEAARDDWKDEAEKLREKLDKANAPQMEADLERSRLMVRQLLEGGEAAKMLHEAARIASL